MTGELMLDSSPDGDADRATFVGLVDGLDIALIPIF